MTTEVLKKKTGRYLSGQSLPAETMQIQNWLSCTGSNKITTTDEERKKTEEAIVGEVKAYIDYTTEIPQPVSWWKKITAFF